MKYAVTNSWTTIETTMELNVSGSPDVKVLGHHGDVSHWFRPTDMRVHWIKENLEAPWRVDIVELRGRRVRAGGSDGHRFAAITLWGEDMLLELTHGHSVAASVVEAMREIVRELGKGLPD